ncbi:DUF2514 family protein [Neopusillimonas maritima]|uniref:DUF2514 domain-containing protein n=1 Tax=Neopusillimonas maritima TaxID=2026239 RepID=A0A3A1YUP8_9BURK|nr:DUF2514 family protein [Neopusillimonas maritima]RIY41932.1 hypothetical protein CJP73_00350 [Neopusillimonas maritima]
MIKALIGWKGYVAAAALAGVAAWVIQGWRYDAKISRMTTQQAVAIADAQAKARKIEQASQAAIVEVAKHADEKIAAATADADAARDSAGRLRTELARLRRASENATVASPGKSQSGIDTIGVLIDVLEGVERNGREVAEYADRLKVAGLACEKAYDSVRSN